MLISVCVFTLLMGMGGFSLPGAQMSQEKEILTAMRKASDFMMNSVSNRGGFLWHYSEDFSRQWGEAPARKSQIWVQPPGTPAVGMMFLEAYNVTGDTEYLKYAERVANALIWGQHSSGGWHYFIDFDPAGIQEYYDEVASKCRAWEEFYHYYGNCAYDDDTTASVIRYLLRLYTTTLNPKYRTALLKGLNFVLESQYPNGAWPQRYPLRYDFSFEGRPDYTSFYTFNDEIISNNIYLLRDAYETLGDERYRDAARKGMDFYIVSQLPSPQAGWAEQYDLEMKPAWARSYEPPSICSDLTVGNIHDLQNFYKITGDRRYLEPIPVAIAWLEKSVINSDPSRKFTHAKYYEVGTNKPLYLHHEHRKNADGKFEIVRYWVDHNPPEMKPPAYRRGEGDVPAGYHHSTEWVDSGHQGPEDFPTIDIEALKKEFKAISSLNLDSSSNSERARPVRFSERRAQAVAAPQEIRSILSSQDARGAWVVEIEFLDTFDFVDNPPIRFRGIDTPTYISNMYKLMNFVSTRKSGRTQKAGGTG